MSPDKLSVPGRYGSYKLTEFVFMDSYWSEFGGWVAEWLI
jgi:hypothetical protein